jgi:hypothetical protein
MTSPRPFTTPARAGSKPGGRQRRWQHRSRSAGLDRCGIMVASRRLLAAASDTAAHSNARVSRLPRAGGGRNPRPPEVGRNRSPRRSERARLRRVSKQNDPGGDRLAGGTPKATGVAATVAATVHVKSHCPRRVDSLWWPCGSVPRQGEVPIRSRASATSGPTVLSDRKSPRSLGTSGSRTETGRAWIDRALRSHPSAGPRRFPFSISHPGRHT